MYGKKSNFKFGDIVMHIKNLKKIRCSDKLGYFLVIYQLNSLFGFLLHLDAFLLTIFSVLRVEPSIPCVKLKVEFPP